jgi:aldehyde dehydrogenase (NAD+)
MLKSTDLKKIGTIVKNATEAFEKGVTISYESRIENLTTLQKFLKQNEKNFSEALFKDLHMNDLACNVEIHEPCNTAEEAMDNLSTWMKPSHPSIPLLQKPGSATIEKEPFGVVLIIA